MTDALVLPNWLQRLNTWAEMVEPNLIRFGRAGCKPEDRGKDYYRGDDNCKVAVFGGHG